MTVPKDRFINLSDSQNIQIRVIEFGSPEYRLAIELRYEILRKPLGLEYDQADLNAEIKDHHIAAFKDNELIAYLLLKPISNSNIKLRQVAVSNSFQGKGIGKQLVQFSEAFAKNEGYKKMFLDARESAVPFYKSLGYEIEGTTFTVITLPHFRMWKDLK